VPRFEPCLVLNTALFLEYDILFVRAEVDKKGCSTSPAAVESSCSPHWVSDPIALSIPKNTIRGQAAFIFSLCEHSKAPSEVPSKGKRGRGISRGVVQWCAQGMPADACGVPRG